MKEVELRRDGKWGQRLMGDRAAVAEIMDLLMQKAPREILAAIPTVKSGAMPAAPRCRPEPAIRHREGRTGIERGAIDCRLQAGGRGRLIRGFAGQASTEVTIALKAY